jgi:enoyl-CoA hydratase
LLAEALDLARTVASNDQVAVRATKQAINRSLEVAGMHGALAEALEMDVLVEATETAESKAFNEILARDGPKAAIEWRRSRTDDESR